MPSLMSKFLCGEANAEEAMQLDDWLADPANAREFQRIRQLWQQLSDGPAPEPPPLEQAWAALESRLPAQEKPAVVKPLGARMMVAAAIVLLLILPLLWLLRQQPTPAVSKEVFGHTQVTNDQEIKTVTIPDGTTITLHHNSSISYSNHFNGSNRRVLFRGEGFFNVVPNSQLPFTINIAELTIKVVGTSFNVKDITPSGNIEVQVLSGVVNLSTSTQEITVQKGHTGIFDPKRHVLSSAGVVDVNSVSYATQSFQFNDLSLGEACRYLEKAFNVTIRFNNPALADCRLSARFDNKSLPYILNIMNVTLNTTSRQQGNTLYLDGQGCH